MSNKNMRLAPVLLVAVLLLGAGLACGRRATPLPPPPQVATVLVPVQAPVQGATSVPAQSPTDPPAQPPANPPAQSPAQPPTDTPLPPPPDPALPVIDYFSSEPTAQANCYYLHWDLHGATAAYLNGQGVAAPGSAEVCPEQTSTYTLRAENAAGGVEQTLTLEVSAPPPEQPQVSPPANLQGRVVGGDLMLTWQDGQGEAGYLLMFADQSLALPADSRTYTWVRPPCGQNVAVTLVARNAAGAEIGRLTGVFGTPACAAADLVVVSARFNPEPVVRGQPFFAEYVIENRGDGAAGPFTVFWQFHAATGLKNCCTQQFDGLAPHGQVSGVFRDLVCTSDPGSAPTWVEVDHDGQVDESDEDNNRVDVTIHIVD